MSIVRRVLARHLQADLSPPLGYPGGPCQVVNRIEQDIRSPHLRDELIEDVETNRKIENADAAKIYHLEQERGVGIAKRMAISPHAQYRMDLRGVTVPAVRAALASFSRLYFSLKSQKGPQFQSMERELHSGQPFRWTDPKMRLTVVFVPSGPETITVVTAFWADGNGDPRATPGECGKTAGEDASTFAVGFFKRHPHLHRYASIKIVDREGSGGSHPEARQQAGQIHLFPKFWHLDTPTRDFVFAHEIGHWVLDEYGMAKLIKDLEESGVDAWDTSNLPFAQNNMHEAFADCFASLAITPAEVKHRYPAWAAVVEKISR